MTKIPSPEPAAKAPVLHVGLPKTATTVLQMHVLRQFAAETGRRYLGSRDIAEFLNARDAGRQENIHFCPKLGVLVSSESLIDWNPARWAANVSAMAGHFGRGATVVLVIRQPSVWLRSIYQQVCHHEGEWLRPAEFFRPAPPHDPADLRPRLDLSQFDLPALIAAHVQTFDRVIVQKYETLSDGRFLQALGASGGVQDLFARELSARQSNRAYSRRAVRLGFALAALRERMGGRPRLLPPEVPLHRNRLDRLFRKAMQNGLDRLLPYQPYQIDWSALPGSDIAAQDRAYAALPDFADYRHGQRTDQRTAPAQKTG